MESAHIINTQRPIRQSWINAFYVCTQINIQKQTLTYIHQAGVNVAPVAANKVVDVVQRKLRKILEIPHRFPATHEHHWRLHSVCLHREGPQILYHDEEPWAHRISLWWRVQWSTLRWAHHVHYRGATTKGRWEQPLLRSVIRLEPSSLGWVQRQRHQGYSRTPRTQRFHLPHHWICL